MKKFTFYFLLMASYVVFFILSCTKEYNNPVPTTTTTSSSTSAGSTSAGSTSAGSTSAGSTSAGSTSAGSTSAGSTSAGSTSAGSTSSSSTTSGTTTASPCTPPDNSFTATNGVGSGNFASITAGVSSGYYGITAIASTTYPSLGFIFTGSAPPAAGVYDVVPLIPSTSTEVGVSLYISATAIYSGSGAASPGKVYVDVSGSTVSITACSVKLANYGMTSDTTTMDGKVIKP